MNQLIIKLITILIFVFSHKYYVSSTLIDYSEKSGTYQISLKIFHDDLEKDLGFEMNELDYNDYEQTNSLIIEYLINNFKKYPLNNKIFENRNNFSRYIYGLHEIINKMLGKVSGLTYCQVRDRYENFRCNS